MARTIKLYQAWTDEDPAESDSFFTSRRDAEAGMREYTTTGEYTIRVITVTLNKKGICTALKYVPMR